MNYLFASTNFGTEKLLEQELYSIGVKNVYKKNGGIYYEANDLLLYQTLMWSRISSRIFLCIKKFTISSIQDLYYNIFNINWDEIFSIYNTFSITFQATNNIICNSLLGSLKIKNAITDQFNKKYSFRPNISLVNPDVRIKACLYENNVVYIMIDLSGEPLNKRGYRKFCSINPIKENLGAAIVLQSGWKKDRPMIDPMCGFGTLLIEAAMIACNRAPGLTRLKWGFKSWKKYDKNLWENTVKNAEKKFKIGIRKCPNNYFIGYDYDSRIIKKAEINAYNAGLLNKIKFLKRNLNNLKNIYSDIQPGILLSNPPSEERYQTESQLVGLYIQLGFVLKKYFQNWKLSIFTTSKFLLNFLQMQINNQYFFKYRTINYIQSNYTVSSTNLNTKNNDDEYRNRLKKNFKKLKKWQMSENIESFRIYDADLPNYNIIVDVYKTWLVIQEYKAPKLVDSKESFSRLCRAIYYTKEILSIPINNIVLKIRKQKKKQQYQKLFNTNNFIIIKEYNIKFLVNLTDYLDTGLFSDKRLVRKLLGKLSKGKDFLNLFSYTGTASVYAALGEANTTTSIDISNTYIKWSIRNMFINNLVSSKHKFIRCNCLNWIKKTNKTFDLIFINPPTFSNSKKMQSSFDLKRDYLNIMLEVKKILRKNGSIIFSSSTKNFKINYTSLEKIKLYAKNITKKVEPKDILKNKNTYFTWLIKHY